MAHQQDAEVCFPLTSVFCFSFCLGYLLSFFSFANDAQGLLNFWLGTLTVFFQRDHE